MLRLFMTVLAGMTLLGWSLLEPVQAQEAGPEPPAESPIIDTAGMVVEKAVEAPKQFATYVSEKWELAEREPWRETADQMLIDDSQVRWRRYLRALSNAPEWLDIGLDHRMRGESLTNNFRQGQPTDIQDGVFRTRFRAGADWKMFRLLFETQNSADTGTTGLVGTINSSLFSQDRLLQAFLAIKLDNVLNSGLRADLHLGRMTLDFGSRRLIARNDFRNTTNTFNGVHWNLAQAESWRMRAFLVRPVADTFGIYEPVRDTLFWGLQYEERRDPWLNFDLYYFGIDGGQTVAETRKFGTYGLRIFRVPEPNAVDYEVESAFQSGTKAGLDHVAHFQHGEIGYTFPSGWLPRLTVQYDYASGTANPAGQSSQTFDTLFGARRMEYTPTGLFGPFFRSNISTPGLRLQFSPRSDMSVTAKYRAWYLAQSRDAWVGSGLQDPTGVSGNFLGQDLELRVQWRLGTYILFDAGYDRFFKGSYVETQARVPGNPPAKDSDYLYFSTQLRF